MAVAADGSVPAEPSAERAVPASVRWLTLVLAAAGAAAGVGADGVRAAGVGSSLPALAVVALLASLVLAARLQLRFSYRDDYEALDLFDAVLAPVILVMPGTAAVAMAAGAMALSELALRTRPVKLAFNVAQWAAATGAGALTFAAIGRGAGLSSRNLLGLGAAMVAVALVNQLALLTVFTLTTPGRFGQLLEGVAPALRLLMANGAVNLPFGLLLVAALQAGAWVTPMFAVLLWMLHAASRGYAEGRADRARLGGLQRATHALVGPIDPRDAIGDFLAEVRDCFDVEVVELVLPVTGGGFRVQRLSGSEPSGTRSRPALELEDTLAGALMRRGETVRVGPHHPDEQLRALLRREAWRDCLAAPLAPGRGSVRGILCAYNRTGLEGFEAGELMVLEALAHELAGAMEKAELVEEVLHQALHDALTGLPNRTLFHQRVQRAISASEVSSGRVAVMLIDVNRFKEVNDTLGHHNGDLLLQDFAGRVQRSLRPGDTVARLGGDEFAIVIPRVASRAEAERVVERILRAIDEPFTLHELTLDVDAAIGVALFPDHGNDPSTLLQRADVAMYAAKGEQSDYEVYSAENDRYSPRRLALVSELRSAASNGQLQVHYQPKLDLRTGAVTGLEALLRWQHPRYGAVSPEEFIPIAEQTGSIRALTTFVLEEALSQCGRWRESGLDVGMAVNLSVRSLLDSKLAEEISRLLQLTGVPASALTLELTESTMMSDPVRTAEVLERLHDLGAQLSIDDYGTGYSSLSYLRRLPVDEVKIDKSFITSMGFDENDDVIVRSTVDLGHNLGLRVVAEGVEDADSWARLVALGCDSAQGFFLSRPIPADQVAPLMARLAAEQAARDEVAAHQLADLTDILPG